MSINDESKEILRLKLISDGTFHGSKIIDIDTGKTLPATGITIQINGSSPYAKAIITIPRIRVEYTGKAEMRQ